MDEKLIKGKEKEEEEEEEREVRTFTERFKRPKKCCFCLKITTGAHLIGIQTTVWVTMHTTIISLSMYIPAAIFLLFSAVTSFTYLVHLYYKESKKWRENFYVAYLICFLILNMALQPFICFFFDKNLASMDKKWCANFDSRYDNEQECFDANFFHVQLLYLILCAFWGIVNFHFAMVLRVYW